MIGIIILLAVVLVLIWGVSQYNFFASTKARVAASVQEIGNQLKRQADLIPNLEASAKGYLKHEKSIIQDLADARRQIGDAMKSGSPEKMSEASNQLSNILPRLQIAVEDNPELKGNEVVQNLMQELRDTSDKVMYARRLFIDLTADYNVKRVSFPSQIIASAFGFAELKGLEFENTGEALTVSKEETKTPKVSI